MGILSLFKKPSRDFFPLMYYAKNESMGNMVGMDDFPRNLADDIILFCRRLHEMGVFEENQIVSFDIGAMLEMLSKWGVLDGVRITSFNRAQVAFGENYVGYWYEDREKEPYIQYMIPEQIAFYHTEKEDNYYLSAIDGGLDLTTNKVSVSNKEKSREKIGMGRVAKLGLKERSELKASFHILFTYLKYKILINADKLGYNAFVEKFTKSFCAPQIRVEIIEYAKQFFSLNTEKKDAYLLAHRDCTFVEFFERIIDIYDIGISVKTASLKKYAEWFDEMYSIQINDKEYDNTFDLLSAANDKLKKIGKVIYFWSLSEKFSDHKILVGEESIDWSNEIGINIAEFSDILRVQYEESILREKELRNAAYIFYETIGVRNVEEFMQDIHGFEVLDTALYNSGYVANIDWTGEDLPEILYEFFYVHGMGDIVEELSVGGKTIDEQRFEDDEDVIPYDRVILYAEAIRRRGKILVFLDTNSDAYDFVMIDRNESSKRNFINAANQIMEWGGFCSYEIFE